MKLSVIKSSFVLLLFVCLSGCSSTNKHQVISADVVIYGGTPAAITAAVELTRSNKHVVIVCPEKHLGGMSSNGLGFTDTGDKNIIGGIAKEFYQRLYTYYDKEEAWNWQSKSEYGNKGQDTPAIDGGTKSMWIFEPHVAENVFENFIEENKIAVYRDHWLDRNDGVEVTNGSIKSIKMLNGTLFKAKIYIDATYEGDLLAAAGVSYHVGRESNSEYNETWNGVQVGTFHHGHNFGDMKISPYKIPGDSSSGVLAYISTDPPGKKGEADYRVQAYCFRLCLTKHEENRVPFEKPAGYDSTKYELLARIYEAGWNQTFDKFDPIPNYKTDVNNHGPFSSDYIGMNYEYPEASYEQRARIIREHEAYQKGLLYFLANDRRVPSEVRQEMNKWGYAKDEFVDNGHWPHQIYVREARRMIGEYIMTENEVLGRTPVTTSIGMGSYTMDSHNVQRYITPDGYVQNEGDIGVHPHKPYQIAMGTVLPQKEECSNLLVPVAVSSSHIAFGSIRMEPVFMILGQSSGVMASMALDKKVPLHDLSYEEVRKELVARNQIIN
ncbi:protein-xanthan lyase [Prolixibacter bellariivorans]|uniref:Protein-xanthan lyase n=2 Tax=Prolixibacter bellariivorans TaxID=314319 RepID=A0A5M4B2Z9_9BACT|nr:FAD-dependent oxidoreductase [Prolixibacter bellariivorans]GET34047.1 protein-xanthan lyase [Prolixibacter bellariivorans]